MSQLTSQQKNILNNLSQRLTAQGLDLGVFLSDMADEVSAGNLGITADSGDVDSLALGGGAFTWDPDSSAGLSFAWKAGRFHNGLANITVVAGALTLNASSTNYVEVNRAGVVSFNTSGFTSGRLPLYVVTTGSSSFTANNVVSAKPLLQLIGTAGVVGAMLSTAGATKQIVIPIGTLSATAAFLAICPPIAGTITGMRIATSTTLAADDTNKWTFSCKNKSNSSVDLLSTGAVNSTAATGGSGMTAYTNRDLTLTGTGANLVTSSKDVLEFIATRAGSAGNLSECVLVLDVNFTG